jgi:hypothetical protein
MFANLDHSLIVTVHAVNALASLGKHKFVNLGFADFTLETVGVIGVVACHDSLVEDRLLTYVATV